MSRSRLLVLSVVFFAAVAVLPAATIPQCITSGTLAQLTGMSAEGCISQDKIFSNFQYTGTVSAANINVNLVLQTGASDIHGWSFVPTTAWVDGFTLSYDISVAPGNPFVAIVLSKDQMNSGGVPNGITINDTQTGVTPSPLAMTGTLGGETVFSNAYNLQTVHTSSVATIPVGRNLLSYEQDFFEGSSIPEPVSFVLIGSGLLGVGLLRRRVSKPERSR
ncbi:MAG: hypothetical protein ABFD89_23545 [Bryobacteraceae bacterium]